MKPGPQFQQLAMFHTAEELRDPAKTAHGDRMADEHPDALFAHKLDSARQDYGEYRHGSLHESIRRRGIVEPVDLEYDGDKQRELTNGHHRVAVAHHLDPKMLVPVNHWDRLR